jgi:predicted nucleic acid-binding protein
MNWTARPSVLRKQVMKNVTPCYFRAASYAACYAIPTFPHQCKANEVFFMGIIRVYADTSVIGGVFDEEFKQPTLRFFDQVEDGQFALVTSAIVQDEIALAPTEVRNFFDEMLRFSDVAEVSEDALELRNAYLHAGIVSPKYSDDALHVAVATVSGCSLIVSWNFKHIVHFQKIPLYNAINAIKGYPQIAIFSPLEVIRYEDEEI